MPRVLTATYRLQLTRDFPLASARAVVPYLHDLGVSHLYLSPVLAARPGSMHGYDVVDPTRVNPELGTEEDLRGLAADLHARGMGIVLDVVPNHMAAAYDNPYWRDVLERGRASRYAAWFDIEWDAPRARGKVVLPILGDEMAHVLEREELRVEATEAGARLAYFDARFPLDPSTLPPELQLAQLDPAAAEAAAAWTRGPEGRRRLERLLGAQHYALACWRRAPADLNYRRFFDVNDLVGVRMETDEVFDATHALVLQWIADGVLDGLRVDHVDGLRNPSWYLAKLRREVDARRHPDAPERIPIFVEKILSGEERLPRDWPVDGTTGYEFLNEVEDVFVDPAGYDAIAANYRGLRRNPELDFAHVAREGKRKVLTSALRPDLLRLARLAHAWKPTIPVQAFAGAATELIVQLEVYRTYVVEPGLVSDEDRRLLSRAFGAARGADGVDPAGLDALEQAFLAPPSPGDTLRSELVLRFQQTSGPATAKGVEDTALYAFVPLVSRNEVGGSPARPLDGAASRLHASSAARSRDWPVTLLATNTHDTKRSADVRARLDALSADAAEWARYVSRWRRLNRAHKRTVNGRVTPDTNTEYLYYQTLLGIWPPPRPRRRVDDLPDATWRDEARGRLVAYMLKAAREAKTWTSWTESDRAYEEALDAFVHASLSSDEHFLPDVARLTAKVADDACAFSLARVLVHCLSPGVPDIYQGDELWNFALVDPDNRRPVDYELRRRLLREITPDLLARTLGDEDHVLRDITRLALVTSLLRFRREHARLVSSGEYVPLECSGALLAFARRHASERLIAIVRTRAAMSGTEGEGTISVPDALAGPWRSVLTGRSVELERRATGAAVLPGFQSCEVLFRDG